MLPGGAGEGRFCYLVDEVTLPRECQIGDPYSKHWYRQNIVSCSLRPTGECLENDTRTHVR